MANEHAAVNVQILLAWHAGLLYTAGQVVQELLISLYCTLLSVKVIQQVFISFLVPSVSPWFFFPLFSWLDIVAQLSDSLC